MVGAGGRWSARANTRGAGSISAQFRWGSPGSPLPNLHRSAGASGHSATRTGASAACCYHTPFSADGYARNKRYPASCSSSAAPRADSHARTRGDSAARYGHTSSADGYPSTCYGNATAGYSHASFSADGYTTAGCTNINFSIDGHTAPCCANSTPSADSHAMIRGYAACRTQELGWLTRQMQALENLRLLPGYSLPIITSVDLMMATT